MWRLGTSTPRLQTAPSTSSSSKQSTPLMLGNPQSQVWDSLHKCRVACVCVAMCVRHFVLAAVHILSWGLPSQPTLAWCWGDRDHDSSGQGVEACAQAFLYLILWPWDSCSCFPLAPA